VASGSVVELEPGVEGAFAVPGEIWRWAHLLARARLDRFALPTLLTSVLMTPRVDVDEGLRPIGASRSGVDSPHHVRQRWGATPSSLPAAPLGCGAAIG
jgi:hypothetical protein